MNELVIPDKELATVALFRGEATRLLGDAPAYIEALHEHVTPNCIDVFIRPEWHGPGDAHIRNCIVVQGAGGPGPEADLPYSRGRVTIKCYSAYGDVALRMATLTRFLLMPPDRSIASWLAVPTLVIETFDVTEPQSLIEPQTKWHYASYSAVLRYQETAVIVAAAA